MRRIIKQHQVFKESHHILPKYYDAWFALGEADTHLGLYTKALNEFNRCKALDSSNAGLYYKMGMAQLKLKQKGEALQDFNRSLSSIRIMFRPFKPGSRICRKKPV